MMFVIKLFIKRLTFGKRRQLCIYEEQSNAQSPSFTLQYNFIWLEFDLTTFFTSFVIVPVPLKCT